SVITLKTLFDQDEALTEVGGAKYLVQLQQNTITIVNAEHYGRTIIDLFRRRESIATYADTIDEMYECDLDRPAESIIEANQGSLDAMLGTGERGGLELLGRRFEGALEQIEEAYKAQATGASGLSTGLSRLDRKIGGLKKAKVYVVAGRTSMGKTSLAENIAYGSLKAEFVVGETVFEKKQQKQTKTICIPKGGKVADAVEVRTNYYEIPYQTPESYLLLRDGTGKVVYGVQISGPGRAMAKFGFDNCADLFSSVESWVFVNDDWDLRVRWHEVFAPYDWSLLRLRRRGEINPLLTVIRETDGTIHEIDPSVFETCGWP
ncbi:MAG: hypothetical protein IID45_12665, partial [Planctomycetes bacterium]|nr:hypothetical protein [Planctomycetota bacterium]